MIAVFLFLSVLSGGKAQAASITVNTDTNPSTCTLDEAIENINDQADTNTDCVEIGSYGTDDTITIPNGTVTLTSGLPQISQPVRITGAGMGETVIDGDNTGSVFNANEAENLELEALTIRKYGGGGSGLAIVSQNTNLTVDQVEIDGTGTSSSRVLRVYNTANDSNTVNRIDNLYIHNLTYSDSTANGMFQPFEIVDDSDRGSTTSTLRNITISNVTSASSVNVMMLLAQGNQGVVDTNVENITFSNITAAGSLNTFLSMAQTNGDDATVNTVLSNATFENQEGGTSLYGGSLIIDAVTLAIQPSDVATANVRVSNVLLTDITTPDPSVCLFVDATTLYGGSGSSAGSLTSHGGNISDNNFCSSVFSEPTDKNGVSNLSSTLGSLSDNGGFVPTIPLLENSPAIDAGVTVAGLSTDARLAARPQGNAFDSGAYESPFTRTEEEEVDESLADTGDSSNLMLLLAIILVAVSGAVIIRQRSLRF